MKQKYGRVGVLYGGTSAERDISLLSGQCVIKSLQRSGVDVVPIDVSADLLQRLPEHQLDRALIMLHGPGGEDGSLQGALQFYGLPYTGSGVFSSALAMDKLHSKQFWQGVDLPTPKFAVLNETTDWQETLDALGGVVMVKPSHEGSSLGMTRADSPEVLKEAWRAAAKLDSSVIAEQWVAGAEYTIAILDGEVLPAIKLETEHTFYDYDAKYLASDTRYLCPCGLSPQDEKSLRELAKKAFDSLNCSGWGRVDVMANSHGEFFLLEVNTVPGMTDHSLVPMAAAAAGYNFDQLVLKILDSSL
ncbi:MAG: D-alanine--D-alanine ligase [Porticoccaceae bacterium]|nr:MAG: D-alanine--D-alanine ligase [Porticoccaceae bacterium]